MKIGGKTVFGFAVLGASIINTLLPLIVRLDEDWFFAARITQGLLLVSVVIKPFQMGSKRVLDFD